MQAELRIGPSVSLADHWQRPTTDRESLALYARARGRSFSVTFITPPTALATLVFRNFYAASLRLVQLNTDGSTRVLLDEYTLMKHAHCEDDAQSWHLIHLDQLRSPPDVSRLASLQFYLFQPSPRFETCELQDLALYERRAADDETVVPRETDVVEPTPSLHQLMRRLSRSSVLIVDSRDVREHATQLLTSVRELRALVHDRKYT